ncbi:uncharacterized protein F5Z01DRAFT_385235 [Emericellopsis atlantica]|uniref:Uncharacterized protein n=1 Tax=Emericellopsis atlantica TaxID=2614577 RepID=A0A9P8CU78_9HYPO|nr:uncharacterized protein F5Z01DRAFT_385235 [Emericellopsis atlantica]KAG9257401.1 hypothetical protein F5Z01DRAFT_385235 [Emericellopsis atlantica]
MTFDPDELTRRLYEVKAQQELKAARKTKLGLNIGERGLEAKERISREFNSRQSTADHWRAAPKQPRNRESGEQDASEAWSRRWSAGQRERHPCPKNDGPNDPKSYHHTPQVAAAQFERTTAVEQVEGMNIHRLSHPAVRFHIGGPHGEAAQDQASDPRDIVQRLQRVRSQRDREYARNQFQTPQSLEEVDGFGGCRHQQRHTLDTYPEGQTTRSSIFPPSDTVRDMMGTSNHVEHRDDEELASNGRTSGAGPRDTRQDWTQSDEVREKQTMNAAPPKIRKAASKWRLRLSGHHKSREEDDDPPLPGIMSPEESEKAPKGLKSPISGFFLRLKR